ncbi:ATP-binding protein [Archangium lipolyticum]|uniref:ATP-binding protein n=1 Tax=Archangium lipolyticum TaxID=2970465 RepID=UPI00214A474D|nr:ATP-binding protein [Archangium lipolyticum]
MITAYLLAVGLVERVESFTVDRKEFEGDKFDDLTIQTASSVVRRQVKWSQEGARELTLSHFVDSNSSLRIDYLVRSYTQAAVGANEYRLSTVWSLPSDLELLNVLEPSTAQPTLPRSDARLFQLRASELWPEGADPRWHLLANVARDEFLAFAERFVIELELPQSSSDLSAPGPLELQLLDFLVSRVGIGSYPNHHRLPADVAAQLIVLATSARNRRRTFTPAEVIYEIGLRVDDGRISQQFPIKSDYQVDRKKFKVALRTVLEGGRIILLVGLPGAGKSWELTAFGDELRKDGYLVARHYCYLEPGDPLVEQRVTINVLVGNLLGELLAQAPLLREEKGRAFASTPDELVRVLRAASQQDPNRPVVLIVDGLDHISRVRTEARHLTLGETAIVEELSSWVLPENVCLIIGSQPGKHLEPLASDAVKFDLPNWSLEEIWNLAERYGLLQLLEQVRIEPSSLVKTIAERSEGSPLYATFLMRELLARVRTGELLDPQQWCVSVIPLQGDINHYYGYLYQHAERIAQSVADILGVIDFAVTESELREIIPPLNRPRLGAALSSIRPVLQEIAGQGGFRVFHESFRRFIVERFREADLTLADALDPVIQWLNRRGFFNDAKAYRYLLPALWRADRAEELLAKVGTDFIAMSVAAGHAHAAVERNLAIALEVAARAQRWPELVRCTELHRALRYCFEDHLFNRWLYWRTLIEIAGAEALAQRLVFEGRPTFPKLLGLVICSWIDDLGQVPPWEEYLGLPEVPVELEPPELGTVLIAKLHGTLRIKGKQSGREWLVRVLKNPEIPLVAIRFLIRKYGQIEGAGAVIALDADEFSLHCRALIFIEAARLLKEEGSLAQAKIAADRVLQFSPRLPIQFEAIEFGVSVAGLPGATASLHSLNVGLNGERHFIDETAIQDWIALCGIVASIDPAQLDAYRPLLNGPGWYRGWLRYVLGIIYAERIAQAELRATTVRNAFAELIGDMRPFVGAPRLIDLTQHRLLIRSTLERGLRLLTSESDWGEVLDILEKLLTGTSIRLRGYPAGPVLPEDLGEILLPYAARLDVREKIQRVVVTQVSGAESRREFFSNQGDVELMLARVLAAADQRDNARIHWEKAARYFAAYGYRRDHAIYEIIRGLPDAPASRSWRLDAIERLQSLANSVLEHTDGKDTRYALNAWFDALLKADPAAALSLLAQSMSLNAGVVDWRLEDALTSSLAQLAGLADPILLTALQEAVRFEFETESEVLPLIQERMVVLDRLLAQEPRFGREALRRFFAQVEGDPKYFHPNAFEWLRQIAQERGMSVPYVSEPVGNPVRTEQALGRVRWTALVDDLKEKNAFPVDCSPMRFVARARELLSESWQGLSVDERDHVVNAIGYRFLEMLQAGQSEEVKRLLSLLAQAVPNVSIDGVLPLMEIAEGLRRAGFACEASVALSLAYARSPSKSVFVVLGDVDSAKWFKEAVVLDRHHALEALALEIVRLVCDSGYTTGIARNVMRRFDDIGENELAQFCWEAAFEVIQYRLPSKSSKNGVFIPFSVAGTPKWSVEEGLVAILLARIQHPVLDVKRRALFGFAGIIQNRPQVVPNPLQRFLARDSTSTSARMVLHALCFSEQSPFIITQAIRSVLESYAQSELWGDRVLARKLLARIDVHPADTAPEIWMPVLAATSAQRSVAEQLDWGERLNALNDLMPCFVDLIAAGYGGPFKEGTMHAGRELDRFELAQHPADRDMPLAPVLHWSTEMFETYLQEALNQVQAYLRLQGRVSEVQFESWLPRLLPRLRIQVGLDASRSLRPILPLPSVVMDGAGEPPILPAEDEFAGWCRIGYVETEIIKSRQDVWSAPAGRFIVMAGAVLVASIDDVSQGIPWGHCLDPEQWFETAQAPVDSINLQGVYGPLVAACLWRDVLGPCWMLVPPQRIAARYGLKPGNWPGPLTWVDHAGQLMLAVRSWHLRPIGGATAAGGVPTLAGCELLMHPRLLEEISRESGRTVSFQIRVERLS